MTTIFRVVSFLEGVSYLLLMGLGMYFKYFLDDVTYVKMFGMPHGILFMLYVVLAFLIQKERRWSNKSLLIVLLASIIPFGTFYIDKKYCK